MNSLNFTPSLSDTLLILLKVNRTITDWFGERIPQQTPQGREEVLYIDRAATISELQFRPETETYPRTMNDSEFQKRLKNAETEEEAISLIVDTAYMIHRTEPQRSLELAKDGLNRAAAHKEKGLQGKAWMTIGLAQMYLGNYGSARSGLQKALSIQERIGNTGQQQLALVGLGALLINIGSYSEAILPLLQATDLTETTGNRKAHAIALNNLGVLYGYIGDYVGSLRYYQQALEEVETIGNVSGWNFLNIGSVYAEMENYTKALEYIEQAFEVYREQEDRHGEGLALLNKAQSLQGVNDTEGSRECLFKSLEVFQEMGNRSYEATLWNYIAKHYIGTGDLEKARDYIIRAVEYNREKGRKPELAVDLQVLAKIAEGGGDYGQAVDLYNEALNLTKETELRTEEMYVHENLGNLYERLSEQEGNLEYLRTSLHHVRQHKEIHEELLSREKQNELATLQMRKEVEAAEKEREILRLKSEQLEMEMETKQKELAILAMQLVQKNELLDSVGKEVESIMVRGESQDQANLRAVRRQVDSGKHSEEEWKQFEQQFQTIHQGFLDVLARDYPVLTATERKVCALLKINLSTKDIASLLCSSPRTIERHRYVIRTKLDLEKGINLSTFLSSLG